MHHSDNTGSYPIPVSVIRGIKTMFSSEIFISAYEVAGHTVDLYMPEYGIVIDFITGPHLRTLAVRKASAMRASSIISHLGCTFISVDRDDNIFVIAGIIYSIIHKPRPTSEISQQLALSKVSIQTSQYTFKLPTELVLLIIYEARCGKHSDLRTLRKLSLVCKDFYGILHKHRESIINHYTIKIEDTGGVIYKLYDKFHREGDLPAVIHSDGTLKWFKHGKLHRNGDRPAIVSPARQTQVWYLHGMMHREGDEPAVVHEHVVRQWYLFGKRHRSNDKPAVMRDNGTCEWWVYGQRIR